MHSVRRSAQITSSTQVMHQRNVITLYNGQQGDMWDAQKDVALAALGALVGLAFGRARRPGA